MRVTTGVSPGAQEVEQDLQFGAAIATGAARFLGTDDLAACSLECGMLDGKILIEVETRA
jgi:hypothetical protein